MSTNLDWCSNYILHLIFNHIHWLTFMIIHVCTEHAWPVLCSCVIVMVGIVPRRRLTYSIYVSHDFN